MLHVSKNIITKSEGLSNLHIIFKIISKQTTSISFRIMEKQRAFGAESTTAPNDNNIEDTKRRKNCEQLYTEGVILMYYSKSKDAEPGKGTGEKLLLLSEEEDDDDTNKNSRFKYGNLQELSKISNWRQRLSNFEESTFRLDGYQWKSVEHYFQAQKFITKAPWHYKSFTMESKSKLSQSLGGPVKKAGGKSVVELTKQERQEWEKIKHTKMKRALYAKYSQNEDLCSVLLYTGNAKLTHKPTRCKHTFVEYDLMWVRRKLQKEKGIIQEINDGTNDDEKCDEEEEDNKKVSALQQQLQQQSESNNKRAVKANGYEDEENQTNQRRCYLRRITHDVEGMKASLSKLLPNVTNLSVSEVEKCQDICGQLLELSNNSSESTLLEVLSKTLIGQVISKFKPNPEVGPTAKILIKKWKQIYRQQQQRQR